MFDNRPVYPLNFFFKVSNHFVKRQDYYVLACKLIFALLYGLAADVENIAVAISDD